MKFHEFTIVFKLLSSNCTSLLAFIALSIRTLIKKYLKLLKYARFNFCNIELQSTTETLATRHLEKILKKSMTSQAERKSDYLFFKKELANMYNG